jgi:hypothetical protein
MNNQKSQIKNQLKIVNTIFLFTIILVINSFFIGYLTSELWGRQIEDKIINSEIISKNFKLKILQKENQCSNKSLEETAYCLRNYVSTFYKYNERDDTEKTLEDIRENGGDCYDYTMLYKKLFTDLNFNAKETIIYTKDKKQGHAFLTVWKNELNAYCSIDMLEVKCYELE